jgi:hypothetical protein
MWRPFKERPFISVVIPQGKDWTETKSRIESFDVNSNIELAPLWFDEEDPPEQIEGVDFIYWPPMHWAKAINQACAETKGDFICLVEEDVFVDEQALLDMVNQFTDPRVGLVGQELCIDGYPHIKRGVWMMTRSCFEACGFFNPNMDRDGWHGVELTLRIENFGFGKRQACSRNIVLPEFSEPMEGKEPSRNAEYIHNRWGVKL